MKSLRRSMNKDPPPISTPISSFPPLNKPQGAFSQPPKKVIRCIRPYRSTSPQELTVFVGDFLYVTRDVMRNDGPWYEVTNPTNNSRGIVPQDCFEELQKSGPTSIQAGPNARLPPQNMNAPSILSRISAPQPAASNNGAPRQLTPKHQTFYAIVQYDFNAERPDELDAKAGEPISVVAQSNREWFVAKPIGRLGGPGLIPVSFVEIRDPLTNQPVRDVDALMDRGVLPKVEEWKQATAEYKASSIPLGVLDDAAVGEGVKDSPFVKNAPWASGGQGYPAPPQQYNTQNNGNLPPGPDRKGSQTHSLANTARAIPGHDDDRQARPGPNVDQLPVGNLISASIPSFHYENDEYWFRIDATWQPSPPHHFPSSSSSNHSHDRHDQSKALQLILYRNYDDFYEFQIALLDAFPIEAGRAPQPLRELNGYPARPTSTEEGTSRILPYMPGPVSYVDDMITSVRRTELDQYLAELVELDGRGAGHVLQHDLVRTFFSPKSGDVVDEVAAPSSNGTPTPAAPPPPPPPGNRWDKNGPIVEEDEVEQEEEGDSYDALFQPHGGKRVEVDEVTHEMEGMRLKPNPSVSSRHAPTRSSEAGSYDSGSRYRTSEYSNSNGGGSRYSEAEYGAGRATPNGGGQQQQRNGNGTRSRNSSPQKTQSRMQLQDGRPSSEAEGGDYYGSSSHPYSSGPTSSSGGHSGYYTSMTPTAVGGHNPYGAVDPKSARSSGHLGADGEPAFLKIKIFHSESDDLIAIRVPPKVTYTQLMGKVRDRLGPSVSMLRYRDSYEGGSSKNWREIEGDEGLREWILKGDKLVLYAD